MGREIRTYRPVFMPLQRLEKNKTGHLADVYCVFADYGKTSKHSLTCLYSVVAGSGETSKNWSSPAKGLFRTKRSETCSGMCMG